MLDFFKVFSAVVFSIFVLVGCSGSDGDDFGLGNGSGDFEQSGSGGTGDSGSDSDEDVGTTNITYVPLSVFEAYQVFSDFIQDGLYQVQYTYPFTAHHFINPLNATSLAPTTSAEVSDFKVTVDDVEIDDSESFPMLQKVVAGSINLRTALVFDVSGSLNGVDIDALIAEAKAYVALAQADANSAIAGQEFVVWAFGESIEELTNGATTDVTEINNALDLVVTRYNSGILGGGSNLHRAVVETIGRYKEDTYDFRDISTAALDDNDLIDEVASYGIYLSQLVLFSSGPDTYLEMDQELMLKAIESQSFEVFDSSTSDIGDTTNLHKPVFYYAVGGAEPGITYRALSNAAEVTSSLTLASGAYSFSAGLIANQIQAMERRIDLDNLYVYRYAFLPRLADHEVLFSSDSIANNFTLVTKFDLGLDGSLTGIGSPGEELPSLVEITSAQDEFLPVSFTLDAGLGALVVDRAHASLSEVTTFRAATRWVNESYTSADYTWTPSAGIVGTDNGDGTYTVTSIAGASETLVLTNNVLGHSATVEITN